MVGFDNYSKTDLHPEYLGTEVWVGHPAGGGKGVYCGVQDGYIVLMPSVVNHQTPNDIGPVLRMILDRPTKIPQQGATFSPLQEGHIDRIVTETPSEDKNQLELGFGGKENGRS